MTIAMTVQTRELSPGERATKLEELLGLRGGSSEVGFRIGDAFLKIARNYDSGGYTITAAGRGQHEDRFAVSKVGEITVSQRFQLVKPQDARPTNGLEYREDVAGRLPNRGHLDGLLRVVRPDQLMLPKPPGPEETMLPNSPRVRGTMDRES